MADFCCARHHCGILDLLWQFSPAAFARRIWFATVARTKTVGASQRRRHTAGSYLRHNRVCDFHFCDPLQCAQKSRALAPRDTATLDALTHLADAADHSAGSFPQRISVGRSDDYSADGALRDRDGQRHLRSGPATSDAAHHERAFAG